MLFHSNSRCTRFGLLGLLYQHLPGRKGNPSRTAGSTGKTAVDQHPLGGVRLAERPLDRKDKAGFDGRRRNIQDLLRITRTDIRSGNQAVGKGLPFLWAKVQIGILKVAYST